MQDLKENQPESPWDSLTAQLHTRSGECHAGLLVDVAKNVVEIDFLRHDRPRLPITERVELVFLGEFLNQTIDASARVIHRRESEGHNLYGFMLDKEIASLLTTSFARRGAFRVSPVRSAAIAVRLQFEDQCHEGTLADVSIGGLAVMVSLQAEIALFATSKFLLEFELPLDFETFEITGVVRNRRLSGNQVRYGIEFVPAETSGFDLQQKRINRFVMRRQKEMLEERRS